MDMKKYIKNGVIITAGTAFSDGGKVYYNPSEAIYLSHGWLEYIEPQPERTLEDAKREKIEAITTYDVSDNVNGFFINDTPYWLSKADRVGLMNSTNILKAAGIQTTSLWYNGIELEVSCDALISMLSQLEIYALECYCTTEEHKAAVNALTSIASVDAYDITAGYPAKLSFNF